MHRIPLLLLFASISVSAEEAGLFANSLKSAGPSFHGVPLRETKFTDLNDDGIDEVLLHINSVEEASIGFLNTELFDAFVWIDIYKLKNGSYELVTKDFPEYLKQREIIYREWIMRLNTPETLSDDSSTTIKANYEYFIGVLNEYISRIENS